MMAEKARVFRDDAALAKILRSTAPRAQKEAGRAVRDYLEERWAPVRYGIVLRGTIEKYRQNPQLWKLLEATGERLLVEASTTDRIWGIGLSPDDPRALDPAQWLGQNLLGRAITEARETLRKGAAKTAL